MNVLIVSTITITAALVSLSCTQYSGLKCFSSWLVTICGRCTITWKILFKENKACRSVLLSAFNSVSVGKKKTIDNNFIIMRAHYFCHPI